jgi:hypothetical protein
MTDTNITILYFILAQAILIVALLRVYLICVRDFSL